MRRLLFILLILMVIGIEGSVCTNAQTDQPPQDVDVVRVNTSLITVPVSVLDRHGRFVPNLTQDQFYLFEDGVEQEIAFFENAAQPFTVALLLDVSDSTTGRINQIREAAAAFVNQLRPDDRVMVIAFHKNVAVLCEATGDRVTLKRAISLAQSGGGTSLYTAVNIAAKRLKQIRGRKAMILFTDGVDTTSNDATYQSTLKMAEELDALIYTVQYNTYLDVIGGSANGLTGPSRGAGLVTARGELLSVAYKRAEQYLRLLSDKTAGRFYYSAGLDRLKEIFGRIAAELREQYSLGYYPRDKSSKSKRALKVTVSVPDLAIKSRRSYVYNSTPE